MARSSTTKPKGNGPGWGGDARRGVSNSAEGIASPGKPAGVKNGEGKKAQAMAALEAAAPSAAAMIIGIASDVADHRALAAAQHILLRVLGDPAKRVELTGADGAPMEIIRRIIDPATD